MTAKEALNQVYEWADPQAKLAAKKLKTTCQKGCNFCCYLLASIGLVEAMNIAEVLWESGRWKALIPKLRDAAMNVSYDEKNGNRVTGVTHFGRRLPCVFLENDACSIYENRPSSCRYHYSISPPEKCSWESSESKMIIDMRELESEVERLDFAFAQGIGLFPMAAPIPLMVLHALALVEEKAYDEIARVCTGYPIPFPYEWMVEHLVDVAKCEVEGMGERVEVAVPR
jgi:Fe-S-cluster containining protein